MVGCTKHHSDGVDASQGAGGSETRRSVEWGRTRSIVEIGVKSKNFSIIVNMLGAQSLQVTRSLPTPPIYDLNQPGF